MRNRHVGLSIVMSLVLVAALALPSWATSPPTQLHIVRASDGSLWKMICVGLSCSVFSSFPGNFASQPSVTWDESIERYVLIGVASDGSIWRSTFDSDGTFQDDWTVIPGNASSPVGSASGDFFESHVWYSSTDATTEIAATCTNYSGGTVTVVAPSSGVVVVEADVLVMIGKSDATQQQAYVLIGESSSDCNSPGPNTALVEIPSGYPNGSSFHTVHVTRSFTVTAGSKTFYLNGYMTHGQSADDRFWDANMKAVFYPY